jgi:hypothetical protein
MTSTNRWSPTGSPPTYVRPFVGAEELLHSKERWCLWLTQMTPGDEKRSPVLSRRLEAVREARRGMRAPATQELARSPQLFAQRIELATRYLAIPRHVSVAFQYFTPAYFEPEVITGDANFVAPDPDGFLLGVLSSSMFITWMKTIGGRIKSDPRFSKTHVYNSFPLPVLNDRTRNVIAERGRAVAKAREEFSKSSLSELYGQGTTPTEMLAAHDSVDKAVDKAFGARARYATRADRQKALFRSYAKLTDQETLLQGT